MPSKSPPCANWPQPPPGDPHPPQKSPLRFLQDENPPRNREKYFHRIYFAKHTKSFPRKIKLKSPTGQNFSVRYNPTVQSGKIFSQDFFAKHKKSFFLKD